MAQRCDFGKVWRWRAHVREYAVSVTPYVQCVANSSGSNPRMRTRQPMMRPAHIITPAVISRNVPPQFARSHNSQRTLSRQPLTSSFALFPCTHSCAFPSPTTPPRTRAFAVLSNKASSCRERRFGWQAGFSSGPPRAPTAFALAMRLWPIPTAGFR